MPKHSSFILESATRNAELRFRDLLQEARLLLQLFPDLRDAFDADELPIAFIVARGSGIEEHAECPSAENIGRGSKGRQSAHEEAPGGQAVSLLCGVP